MFSLICAWINNWVNNREAGDLRRHRAHYDVIVMIYLESDAEWESDCSRVQRVSSPDTEHSREQDHGVARQLCNHADPSATQMATTVNFNPVQMTKSSELTPTRYRSDAEAVAQYLIDVKRGFFVSGFTCRTMMTSSNKDIFRVTGPLCGEFTGHGEVPAQRPVRRSFDIFFDLRPNLRLSKKLGGWWFETQSRPLRCHCNALNILQNQFNVILLIYINEIVSIAENDKFISCLILHTLSIARDLGEQAIAPAS